MERAIIMKMTRAAVAKPCNSGELAVDIVYTANRAPPVDIRRAVIWKERITFAPVLRFCDIQNLQKTAWKLVL
jgi:hypothetical protein